jgi:decaprenylphospho-beta-D-ribofuranose 2-oxidase
VPEPGSAVAELTGWGRTAPTAANLTEIRPDLVAAAVTGAGSRGVIARGLGRSYGDAAQNAGGSVLGALPSWINTEGLWAPEPVVRVSAGMSLHELMRMLLPTGHFVPVTPGTRQVTVGGAVAADVHGKNHHRDGSMGRHVVSLDLVLADGSSRTVSAQDDADLFWATIGGMGLTGVITGVAMRPTRVETGYVRVRTERIDDLDHLMGRMREADDEWTHSVAWIDTLARGRRLGRAVLTVGEHARLAELTPAKQKDRWALPGGALVGVPPHIPPRAMSRPAIRAFNELWFRKAPRLREDELQSVSTFFHPLDGVRDWNRLYGPRGFVQYQFVIPDEAESELPGLLQRIAEAGHPSFLSVLKRFGPGAPGPLSFPMAGWTLAMDLPTAPGLRPLFAHLDEVVAACGGRLYLAKDSRMSAAMLRRTYPRLDEFLAVRDRVDPGRVFSSDLSRRLEL